MEASGPFVKLSGVVVVEVHSTESLTIEAVHNIMPPLTTEVRNGRLELGPKSSISPTHQAAQRGASSRVTSASPGA
jgi:hypothetical protein